MELMTTCRTCGETWTPDQAAYVRGTWRTCQRCRDGPDDEVSGVALDDSKRAKGEITRPKCQVGRKPIMSTTETETVFNLEADRIEARLAGQREQLRRTPGDRILELAIAADVEKVRQLRRDHDVHAGVERAREAADAARAQAARAELEAKLMAGYRKAGPGITEAEAKAALPDLLHRARLAEQDRLDAAFAAQRRRIGNF